VTLARLVLAWLPVAVEFVIACSLGARLRGIRTADVAWRSLEAAVTTLFASLWFNSLGSGEWWLVFFLVGLLVGFPARLPDGRSSMPRDAVRLGLRDTARYVLAGAILAWRLG
jgi:hypothetical protein